MNQGECYVLETQSEKFVTADGRRPTKHSRRKTEYAAAQQAQEELARVEEETANMGKATSGESHGMASASSTTSLK